MVLAEWGPNQELQKGPKNLYSLSDIHDHFWVHNLHKGDNHPDPTPTARCLETFQTQLFGSLFCNLSKSGVTFLAYKNVIGIAM